MKKKIVALALCMMLMTNAVYADKLTELNNEKKAKTSDLNESKSNLNKLKDAKNATTAPIIPKNIPSTTSGAEITKLDAPIFFLIAISFLLAYTVNLIVLEIFIIEIITNIATTIDPAYFTILDAFEIFAIKSL